MDNYIGRLLDNRYEILEVIGTGGMAVVYKALCHRLNRLVAIKILKDEFSKDEDFHRRFHAESQAVAMLSHPNIVSVYDVSRSGDTDYIVMELIEGITMKQYLDKKGCMNWRETLHFSMQIAKALEHAHSRGIIHRDIKPHNVMILKDGSVKVADFGIARMASAQNTLTREALGSVHYISPEQAKGGRVDNRTDIYSLGVVMYQMLTGRTPYDGETPVAVAIQHINGNLLPPSQLNSSVPKGLEQIILRAMAVNPDERYSSASDMLRDMEEFRKNPAVVFGRSHFTPAAPEQTPPTPPRPVRRPAQNIAEQKAGYAPENRRTAPVKKEKNNMGMIIAIIACAVVLIGAIVVFASLKSCGTGTTKETEQSSAELHTVPNFVGLYFEDIDQSKYPYLRFETEEENSDQEKGKVIRQSLDADAEIKGDRTMILTISLGQKTQMLTDLSGKTEEEARKWLEDLKMDIVIKIERQSDDDVEEGRVIKTTPDAGAEIAAGDTVTLYVSEGDGPVEVPKVVGMTVANAISLLTGENYGLTVDYEYEYNSADKDTVIDQSIKAGTEVEKGTKVILTVSNGPEPTEPPTTPTEPPVLPTVKVYELTITPMEEDATLEVRQGNSVIKSLTVPAGTTEVEITLEGVGTQYYDIYINGQYTTIIRVNFDE